MAGLLIAIVGAESTGKTWLSASVAKRLAAMTGLRCAVVSEWLRDWCEREGRTPRVDEQAAIAARQLELIDGAAATHDIVLCDTSPLMTAIYSEYLFADRSLLPAALDFHRRCALTLLTALDLPWIADGLQRDGAHVRAPIDALLRRELIAAGLRWSVVAGHGDARVDAALDAITPLLLKRQDLTPEDGRAGLFTRLAERQAALPEWRWTCENCDVPECEHGVLRRTANLTTPPANKDPR